MLETKQLLLAFDFDSMGEKHWKSMATVNCSVTLIFQNIFICVQQKKETHTGLKWHEVDYFHYRFKLNKKLEI